MNKPRALDKLPSATAGLQPIKWADLPPEQRREYLERTLDDYESLIREIVDSSNRCVVKCEQFMRANSLWRWIVIVSTGTIALVNILAGHLNSQVAIQVGHRCERWGIHFRSDGDNRCDFGRLYQRGGARTGVS